MIAGHGLNLTKLESRPRPGRPFEYLFYVDVEGNVADQNVQRAMDEISGLTLSTEDLRILPGEDEEKVPAAKTFRTRFSRSPPDSSAADRAANDTPERRKPAVNGRNGLRPGRVQYRCRLGSILAIHSRIPPLRFWTRSKPFSRSRLTAFALRTPDLQWTMMSGARALRQLVQALRQLAERNQHGALDARDVELAGLADVEQEHVAAGRAAPSGRRPWLSSSGATCPGRRPSPPA